jgi:hypothetical protein
VFQKQYGIVAANRGAQQASGIERIRRENNAQPRNVREHALAALRVIDGAAGKISADGHANHDGHENALFERQRITDSSSRICIIAGQM